MKRLQASILALALLGCVSDAQQNDIAPGLRALRSSEIAAVLGDTSLRREEYSIGAIEPPLGDVEFFCRDGRWSSSTGRFIGTGRYSIEGGILCLHPDHDPRPGTRRCRRMFRDDEGQLYTQYDPSGGVPPIRVSVEPHACAQERD